MPTKAKRKTIYNISAIILGLILGFFLYNNFLVKKVVETEPQASILEDTKYDNIRVYTQENLLNEGRSLLHISYPVSENEEINELILGFAQDFISEFEKIASEQEKFYQDYKRDTGEEAVTARAEYIQHFDVSFASDKYLLFQIYQYRSTGGTGSDDVVSFLFNRESGQRLNLADLFLDENYLEIISVKVRDILEERAKAENSPSDFNSESHYQEWMIMREEQVREGTEPRSENFDSFEFSQDKELVIIFDKYQIGPGSDGIVSVAIPLRDIASSLSEEVRVLFNIDYKESQEQEDLNNKEENVKEEGENISTTDDASTVDCSISKCVALTFDDGPSLYTDRLLDILKENDIKATFFVLGRSAKIQKDTIKRMVAEGHELGNHSYDHKNLSTLSQLEVLEQITSTNSLIEDISAYKTKLLRPPYGAYSEELLAIIDMPLILWSIDPEDWKDRDKEIVEKRMSLAQAGDIILAHDIYPTTIDAIPGLIDKLKQKGLVFVRVSELLGNNNLKAGAVIRRQS